MLIVYADAEMISITGTHYNFILNCFNMIYSHSNIRLYTIGANFTYKPISHNSIPLAQYIYRKQRYT